MPDDGDTVAAVSGRSISPAFSIGEQWLVAPPPRAYDDPGEATFANARRTPHPIGCFTEPVRLGRPLEDFEFSRTYIKATADAPDAPGAKAFWSAAERARSSPVWRYREIATSHMVASNRPHELAALLQELA